MSIQVWHQPQSGRIASKLQVVEMGNAERGWDSAFPACRRPARDITKIARYEVPGHDAKRMSVPPGTIETLDCPNGTYRLTEP